MTFVKSKRRVFDEESRRLLNVMVRLKDELQARLESIIVEMMLRNCALSVNVCFNRALGRLLAEEEQLLAVAAAVDDNGLEYDGRI